MTLQILVQIILWFFGIALLFGVILITFLFGKASIKDKPYQGAVFIKTGLHISKPIKAQRGDISSKGSFFMYGKKGLVLVPKSYKENYYCNRRIIFVSHTGQLIASPFQDDITLSSDEKNDLIYELCASHIGSDGMRAMRGKSQVSIMIIAVIAFIIGVSAILGFNAFQEQMAKRQVNPPQQQQEIKITPNIP